jgi:hypothetical protein
VGGDFDRVTHRFLTWNTVVTAALGLLRKTLPDLSATELKVDSAQPIAYIPPTIQDVTEWARLIQARGD